MPNLLFHARKDWGKFFVLSDRGESLWFSISFYFIFERKSNFVLFILIPAKNFICCVDSKIQNHLQKPVTGHELVTSNALSLFFKNIEKERVEKIDGIWLNVFSLCDVQFGKNIITFHISVQIVGLLRVEILVHGFA